MSKPADLYFILNPALGIIKIGIATDVDDRRYALECSSGVPLDVLGVLRGGGEFEGALLAAFNADRLIGEWFSPSEDLCRLADDPSLVRAYIDQNAARIKAGRERAAAALQERRREGAERRRAERDEAARAEVVAAHGMAIRENRRRNRRIAKDAAMREAAAAAEMQSKIATYSQSVRVVDRLLARELVAAVNDRKTTLSRISEQRLRNAALAGVRHARA